MTWSRLKVNIFLSVNLALGTLARAYFMPEFDSRDLLLTALSLATCALILFGVLFPLWITFARNNIFPNDPGSDPKSDRWIRFFYLTSD